MVVERPFALTAPGRAGVKRWHVTSLPGRTQGAKPKLLDSGASISGSFPNFGNGLTEETSGSEGKGNGRAEDSVFGTRRCSFRARGSLWRARCAVSRTRNGSSRPAAELLRRLKLPSRARMPTKRALRPGSRPLSRTSRPRPLVSRPRQVVSRPQRTLDSPPPPRERSQLYPKRAKFCSKRKENTLWHARS
jgi:hypothetical protein